MIKEEKSLEDSKATWAKYGLGESPFFTNPTRLVGILPIEKVFSGRENETKNLVKIITSSSSSRVLVTGEFGVGKTTFVNYVKWLLCLKGQTARFITTSSEIKVQPEWNSYQFLLSTLAAIHSASIIFKWDEKDLNFKSLKKIEEYVAISSQQSYQASIGGFGAGVTQSKYLPPSISPEILENLLVNFASELMAQGKQIVLSYDNLENIDHSKLASFLRTIKEYLQIEGIHFIFIGPPSTISSLEQYPQVNSVFSLPVVLSPLTDKNVLDILKKRCIALKLQEGEYIAPYDEETVKEVYRWLNNIRFTFKVLEDATLSSDAEAPCVITMKQIMAVQEKEKNQIMSNLTAQQTKIVSALLETEDITLTKLAEFTNIRTTNIGGPLWELEKKGLITIISSEKDKRAKLVKLSNNSYLKMFFTSGNIKKNNGDKKKNKL